MTPEQITDTALRIWSAIQQTPIPAMIFIAVLSPALTIIVTALLAAVTYWRRSAADRNGRKAQEATNQDVRIELERKDRELRQMGLELRDRQLRSEEAQNTLLTDIVASTKAMLAQADLTREAINRTGDALGLHTAEIQKLRTVQEEVGRITVQLNDQQTGLIQEFGELRRQFGSLADQVHDLMTMPQKHSDEHRRMEQSLQARLSEFGQKLDAVLQAVAAHSSP